jgi:hypothetical protein
MSDGWPSIEAGTPVWVFILEARIPEEGGGEEGARCLLRDLLDGVDWADKGHFITIAGEWRKTADREREQEHRLDDHAVIPAEQYELVPVEALQPGDQIYLMARRRLVMAKPYHPEEMRPEMRRIPMSDTVPGEVTMAPPFEQDHLVPRLIVPDGT